MTTLPSRQPTACEIPRKLARLLGALLVVGAIVAGPPGASPDKGGASDGAWPVGTVRLAAFSVAQPEHQAPDKAHAEEGAHEGGWLSIVARLVNFGVLVGVLVYFLRSPLSQYLRDRHAQIRQDLITAAGMRDAAAKQMQEIESRLSALPGELDRLRARGAEEIAAEDARIRQAAEAERQRLLQQTRREIELHLRIAQHELVAHAAGLAIGLATDRIKRNITGDDQQRLVDRYIAQVQRS
jgi:F-type H+-transporting ATPase subunit b